MANSETQVKYVLDQLDELGGVTAKNMFGGTGFYKEGVMFGLMGADVFRLRVNDDTKPKYIASSMEPFRPYQKGKGMPYYEVPLNILEDPSELCLWAREAWEVAVSAKK
ncbi:TfoX/Sxy family protein [Jiulongibacter sp. NS-SX5]|uniref:TfoX/Sxy family protein n=1 Tax=Jiulongibacter sp. NS-SX5 TaxID=3463854 RepID=UPI0040595278